MRVLGIETTCDETAAAIVETRAEGGGTILVDEVRSQIAAQGADPVGNSAAEFNAFISRELVKWAKLIKEAGIKAEPSG